MGSPFPFRTVHVGALALCAIFLPWSTAFLSMAQMLLAANWLAEGIAHHDLKGRFLRVARSPVALVFLSFLGLHVLGLAWTEDLEWGLDLVRILLPVLVFGVILSASPRLTATELRTVLLLGAWSAVASTMVCLLMADATPGDYRSLSAFISHIRLALLLAFAVAVLVHFRNGPWWHKAAHFLAAAWAVWFITRLGSLQGLLMLVAIAGILAWRAAGSWPTVPRWVMRGVIVLLPLGIATWLAGQWGDRHRLPPPEIAKLEEYTAGGERYIHDMDSPQTENGMHVWTYLAWGEVERAWALRGGRPLDQADDRGHALYATLARYMTSLGLRKDSVGVMSLSENDLRAIHAGHTHARQGERPVLTERLEEVFFELDRYLESGDANGHSVTMRLEYLRAGWAIARAHWPAGVGTGDTRPAFAAQYERMDSTLRPEWRNRAHNQYLTLWISFGVFGMAWALFSLWWPAWKLGAWQQPLFIAWAVIFGLSCLTDDTIETQAGATFFALYYTLLVFAAPLRPAPATA